MYSSTANIRATLGDFNLEGLMMRYNVFVPRLYNFCKSLGFEPCKIMPSRAFCSDESQGYPIILITKHFGTFPFNHGHVGGVVATDRHGPHADHGKDMVIIQASHVGYDPTTQSFGTYRRIQTVDNDVTPNCGKVEQVLRWYQSEYTFAAKDIFLHRQGDDYLITIDNQLLREGRTEGLFLNLDRIVTLRENGELFLVRSFSTSKSFLVSEAFRGLLKDYHWPEDKPEMIGTKLLPELFHFKRDILGDTEGQRHMEKNLINPMPWIVTSAAPLLTAAQVNTQVEFDRTFRTIVKERGYRGKKLVYISGLNIDISPQPGQLFPLTKFVPWAAYIQNKDETHYTLEQTEVFEELNNQSIDNLDQIDLEDAIRKMGRAKEIKIVSTSY